MTDQGAIDTILSQERCFCLHGAYKDCNSQCPIREALDHMIAVTKHHEDEVYKAFQAGYDEAREAYDGTGPDAEYDDEDYEEESGSDIG